LVYAGVPADAPDIVAEFRRNGGAGMVIISSDFSETGNKELEERMRLVAGEMPYVGPNGLGVYSARLNTFFIDEKRTAYPQTGGTLAAFSQSGGLALETFLEYPSSHDIRLNEIFSLGNGSGISFTEILNSVADNQSVKSVVLHLEGGLKEGEGPYFIDALKKATSRKPVIVLPAGLSARGSKIAASHTGRMTSGADGMMAALKQGGAIVAKNEEELRLVLWMLHTMPPATGKAIVFTVGGGKGVFYVDAAERIGVELRDKLPVEFSEAVRSSMPAFADCTQNPLDLTGSINLDCILSVLEHSKVIGSPGVFHLFMCVPGGTLRFIDGKPVRLTELDAVDMIAKCIKKNDLPIVLNICAQSSLGKELEAKAEEAGIVVTRTLPSDSVLGALKIAREVWQRYPDADIRGALRKAPKDARLLAGI
jgi:acyl-CoA synthetase (NDP forming)